MRDKSTLPIAHAQIDYISSLPFQLLNSAAMATGLPSASARAKVVPPPVPTRGHSSHQASPQGVPMQNVGMPMVRLAPQPVSPLPPMELRAAPGGVSSSRGRPAVVQAPHTVAESQFGGISRQPPVSQQQLPQPVSQQSATFAGSSVSPIEVQTLKL